MQDDNNSINLHSLLQYFFPSIRRARNGNYYSPWRDEKSPSLSVYINKKGTPRWKDHGTGESGTAYDLVMKQQGLSFAEAKSWLQEHHFYSPSNPPLNGKVHKPVKVSYIWQQCKQNMHTSLQYLSEQRGIDIHFLTALKSIGYNNYRDYGQAVAFPLISAEGKLKALIMRYINEDSDTKDRIIGQEAKGTFYTPDWQQFVDAQQVVLCEGAIDALTVASVGFCAVSFIGARYAASFPVEAIEGKTVLIWADNDEAGIQAAQTLKNRLNTDCEVIFDKCCKDANDALRTHGVDFIRDFIRLGFEKDDAIQNYQSFGNSDLGNCDRFIRLHHENVRYCHDLKSWFVWDGSKWQRDIRRQVFNLAKQTVMSIYAEASKEYDDSRRKSIARHALKSEGSKEISQMLSLAISDPSVAAEYSDFDKNGFLLNLRNGTFDLKANRLLGHNKDDLITRKIDITYDRHARCPEWLNFLNTIMAGNQQLIDFLQCALGYSLTSDTSEECLFFLHGDGRNGKSTFIGTALIGSEDYAGMLTDYARKLSVDSLMQRKWGGSSIPNDIARLKGARVVVASEVQQGGRLNEALVKDITGEDTVTARFLHSEFFDFKPNFKLWMYGNHKPTIVGMDEGIWRRIMLIPFNVQIPLEKVDKGLKKRLKGEISGILNWAIAGCLRWQKEGLNPPVEVLEANKQYRGEMDTIGIFLEECCVRKRGAIARAGELYEAYENWCSANGERPLSQRRLGERLIKKGFEKKRVSAGYDWLGIGLIDKEMYLHVPLAGVKPHYVPLKGETTAKGTQRYMDEDKSFVLLNYLQDHYPDGRPVSYQGLEYFIGMTREQMIEAIHELSTRKLVRHYPDFSEIRLVTTH